MVKHCSKCSKYNYRSRNPETSFHALPVENKRRNLWLSILGLEKANLPKHVFICSDHFHPGDLKESIAGRRVLRPDAIPIDHHSVFDSPKSTSSPAGSESTLSADSEIYEDSPVNKRLISEEGGLSVDIHEERSITCITESNVPITSPNVLPASFQSSQSSSTTTELGTITSTTIGASETEKMSTAMRPHMNPVTAFNQKRFQDNEPKTVYLCSNNLENGQYVHKCLGRQLVTPDDIPRFVIYRPESTRNELCSNHPQAATIDKNAQFDSTPSIQRSNNIAQQKIQHNDLLLSSNKESSHSIQELPSNSEIHVIDSDTSETLSASETEEIITMAESIRVLTSSTEGTNPGFKKKKRNAFCLNHPQTATIDKNVQFNSTPSIQRSNNIAQQKIKQRDLLLCSNKESSHSIQELPSNSEIHVIDSDTSETLSASETEEIITMAESIRVLTSSTEGTNPGFKKKKRYSRYVGDFQGNLSPTSLEHKWELLKKCVAEKTRKIEELQEEYDRLKSERASQKSLLTNLKNYVKKHKLK